MKLLSTRIAVCFFTFFISITTLHAQQFKWVTGGGTVSSFTEQVNFMCTDPNGNVYVLSNVGNDPITADTFHATPYGATDNILLTSYNCSGQMRWAKLIASSSGNCTSFGLAADSLGHIYVAGSFIHTSATDVFHIGYDTSITGSSSRYLTTGLIQFDTTGHFNWIRFVGPNTFAAATSVYGGPITEDAANNTHYFCYITTGTTLMTGVTSVYGVYDMTYNTAGTLLSAVRLDLDSEWYLMGAVIDPSTNKLYVCGQVNQSFGAGVDTFFAAAFDASRNLLWQYFAGHGNAEDAISSITLDQSKHLHFAGNAASPTLATTTFSFNGDSVSNTHYGLYAMSVVLTTDTNGHPEWIKKFDGSLDVNGFNSITQLPNNKVAAFGTFVGKIIDNQGDSLVTPAGDGYSPYLAIYDSAGDLQTVQQTFGDGFYNVGIAITSDKVGNIYIGGYVTDSIWAGPPAIPAYHSIGGNTDLFVMKYGVDCSCTSMPIANYSDTGTSTIGFTYTGTTSGIDSVVWNFGDGSATITGITPFHTYTASGTFNACATVYTSCGSDIHCSEVVVPCSIVPTSSYSHAGVPIVNFTYTGTTSGIDSVIWQFGDGGVGNGLTPTHTYTALGTYTVCATAYTVCDSNTFCDTVVIGTLSASALNVSNVQVFPNPANDKLYITDIVQSTSYRLLNVTGECMQQGILKYGSNALSLKTFAQGIYILEMTGSDGERSMVRVVKE